MDIKKAIAYFKQIIPGEGPLIVDIPDDDQPFCLPFSEDISIFFLIDNGDNYTLVQNRDLERQNISPAQLFEIGINNLDNIRENEIEVSKHNETLIFSGNGNLEASLLLIPELWDIGLESFCPNGYVAAIPARDVLAVCDRNDSESISELREIIERVWPGGDHLLSKTLFVRENGRWTPSGEI
ncbi:DUF1444 family protein [Microbulbifer yueqingensis]|uniref:DUF1444 family protein n=1 Tax=Microbulbifer yueqingensis TaxID=658219 RepID=A0A1G8V2L0_9GAMM|nr:DUF1444 family protein [Microbulbifer yueqingensis]SDJ60346.1 Protein of unknown function [Microbulbifer yueqingensis]